MDNQDEVRERVDERDEEGREVVGRAVAVVRREAVVEVGSDDDEQVPARHVEGRGGVVSSVHPGNLYSDGLGSPYQGSSTEACTVDSGGDDHACAGKRGKGQVSGSVRGCIERSMLTPITKKQR